MVITHKVLNGNLGVAVWLFEDPIPHIKLGGISQGLGAEVGGTVKCGCENF